MNRRPLPCVVRNLRPIPPTVQLMPGVVLYDHEADPDDVPVLPDLVALALSVNGWFGDDCGCDENPCPLTLPAVTAHPRPVTA